MFKIKTAKIYFCLAALLLVAKPFLGFEMFSSRHPPADENIFVKAFAKRKLEYTEDSIFDILAIQKKLADSVLPGFVRLAFSLCTVFRATFDACVNIANRLLLNIKLTFSRSGHSWLRYRKLVI